MTGAVAEPVLALEIRRVRYADGTVALRDVSLSAGRGEIVGVVGHVGAGKTTLALTAAGLLGRGRGIAAEVEGRVHAAGARAAFVFANPWTQLTELGGTVEEEVAVGPENLALASAEIRGRVDRALELVGATTLATRLPLELSGGELQRVALASALALETPLLVLDEPTAQLDPDSTRAFADLLRALAAAGCTVLLVEQDLDLVRELASQLLVLADGAPLAAGAPAPLLDRWPPLDGRLGAPPSIAEREAVPRPTAVDMAGPPLLQVDGLTAGYGDRDVLTGVSLAVKGGSCVAWLGRNGAGKTTLARALLGLVPARAGSVRVGTATLDEAPVEARARHIGLVFQDPDRQLFSRTVLEEAMFAPRAQGLNEGLARERAREALEAVGLVDLGAHPGDLAPQARRRLAVAAAMAAAPPLLILDEPTAGQDAAGRRRIAAALDLQRTRGAAAVITHDLAFARRWCDDALMLEGGRVVSRGLPAR